MKKNSKHEMVYTKLKEMIAKGRLRPGERLIEEELAKQFKVSRTPLRKAIEILEHEGLIELVPNVGAKISSINNAEFIMSLEAIEGIEGMCAYLAAERFKENKVSEAEVACLNECINFMDKISAEKETVLDKKNLNSEWVFYDNLFHSKMVELSKNSFLIEEYHHLELMQNRIIWLVSLSFIDKKEANDIHKELFNAIINGDSYAARNIAQERRRSRRVKINGIIKEIDI